MTRVLVREPAESRPASGLLERLRRDDGANSASGRKITRVVLANPAIAAMETLSELAERAGVSDSSIVRFVRQQGYRSFQEFKVSLAFDAAQEAAQYAGPPAREQGDLLSVLLAQSRAALDQTFAHLPEREVRAVAGCLLRADQVLVCGAGSSGVIAEEYNYKLLRLGLRVTSLRDPHMAAMQATLLGRHSVLIAISRSGATTDILRILRRARERAATTIVVTSKPKSTAARMADHVLLAAGAESPIEGGSLNSEISAMFILNAIYAVLLDLMPDSRELLVRTAQAVSDARE